jgi:hypothetical protein
VLNKAAIRLLAHSFRWNRCYPHAGVSMVQRSVNTFKCFVSKCCDGVGCFIGGCDVV